MFFENIKEAKGFLNGLKNEKNHPDFEYKIEIE
jgi:hypothetical protein